MILPERVWRFEHSSGPKGEFSPASDTDSKGSPSSVHIPSRSTQVSRGVVTTQRTFGRPAYRTGCRRRPRGQAELAQGKD